MKMAPSHFRDVVDSFSPSVDLFAMCLLDGRIKKKRKLGSSILVLGTGGGDVLALDVSVGQLKWRVNNCHPRWNDLHYIDSMVGTLLNKFNATSRVISSLAISPVVVHSGKDVALNVPQDGILLPFSQRHQSKKGSNIQSQVTALDRSNAEGALRHVPKILNLINGKSEDKPMESDDKDELDAVTLCMEERLKSLGILGSNNELLTTKLDIKLLKDINLDGTIPHRKVKATVAGMEPNDALNLLKGLVDIWKNRFHDGLRWICCILVYHSDYIKFQDPKLLDSLYKATKSQGSAINSLFQLSGRLQLVSAQIDKASNNKSLALERDKEEDESEDEEEDVDAVIYGLDEDSELESDGDD